MRFEAGMMYTLSSLADEGHVYGRKGQLVRKAAEFLEAQESRVVMTLDQMVKDRDLIVQSLGEDEEEPSTCLLFIMRRQVWRENYGSWPRLRPRTGCGML